MAECFFLKHIYKNNRLYRKLNILSHFLKFSFSCFWSRWESIKRRTMPREVYSLFVDVKRSTQFLMEWPNHKCEFVASIDGNLSGWTAWGEILSFWSSVNWVKLWNLMLVPTCSHCFSHVCRRWSNSVIILVGCAWFLPSNLQDIKLCDIFLEDVRVHVSFGWNQVSARVHVLRSTRRGGVSVLLSFPPNYSFCFSFDASWKPRKDADMPQAKAQYTWCTQKQVSCLAAWWLGDAKVSDWECVMNWRSRTKEDSFKVFNPVAVSAGRLDMALRHLPGPATWSHFPSMLKFWHVLLRGI